jgi:eukaryotic-like serine/threonine-protein kinase
MNVTLIVTAGPHAGKEFVFDRHDTFLVGRSKDAHFKLSSDDPYFSRRHFLVEVNPPRVRVLDLNSRNGISVNGNKVKKADLKDGDELKAGHTVFRVNVPQPDPDLQGTLDLPSANPLPVSGVLVSKPTSAPKPPAPETTVQHTVGPPISGYRIEVELGRGAMGVVYRATRAADGQVVAVKVITPVAGVTEKDAQRFLREARIVNALEHKNIIRGLDSGESDGLLYLVMELVTGPDLRDRVKDRGPMEVKTAVRLMLHALDGLAHAHAKGFVHRDIKPANLLLDGPKDRRVIKVADFGLARAYNECGISGLTMQDEIGGTPAFMAPEQVTHYRDAKPAADQYAAAATLYFLLCGQYVLDFETATTAQMVQIVTDDRIPIRKRRADIPAGLEAALMKALSREPGDRHRDVAALKDAIRPFA